MNSNQSEMYCIVLFDEHHSKRVTSLGVIVTGDPALFDSFGARVVARERIVVEAQNSCETESKSREYS
jgi:predicted N-acetyltransferase YhbS